jgi:hypothetical protein
MIPKGVFKLMAPMMKRTGRMNLRATADALKRYLERAETRGIGASVRLVSFSRQCRKGSHGRQKASGCRGLMVLCAEAISASPTCR